MRIDTVGELKEFLEDLDDDIEIKIGLQPRYPMVGSLQNVCVQTENYEPKVLWLACSDNENYGCPRSIWDESEIEGTGEDDE